MAEERIYTIPLRREFRKAPIYRRTKRALKEVKEFLAKHMKAEEVKIGKYLNLELWKHGRKNPPAKIKIRAVRETVKIKEKDVVVVRAELINAPVEVVKEEKKDNKKTKEKKEEVPKIKETELEDKIEKLEEEKKEVLESKKVDHKEKRFKEVKAVQGKSQREKRAGIIGETGKK